MSPQGDFQQYEAKVRSDLILPMDGEFSAIKTKNIAIVWRQTAALRHFDLTFEMSSIFGS